MSRMLADAAWAASRTMRAPDAAGEEPAEVAMSCERSIGRDSRTVAGAASASARNLGA
jgi:hypothetical protein